MLLQRSILPSCSIDVVDPSWPALEGSEIVGSTLDANDADGGTYVGFGRRLSGRGYLHFKDRVRDEPCIVNPSEYKQGGRLLMCGLGVQDSMCY